MADTSRRTDNGAQGGDENGQLRALVETCLNTNDLTPMVGVFEIMCTLLTHLCCPCALGAPLHGSSLVRD